MAKLTRDEAVQIRCALAEAWFQQDDLRQATDALGDPPEERERLHPLRLSDLWRLHARLAIGKGEPSRAIALSGTCRFPFGSRMTNIARSP